MSNTLVLLYFGGKRSILLFFQNLITITYQITPQQFIKYSKNVKHKNSLKEYVRGGHFCSYKFIIDCGENLINSISLLFLGKMVDILQKSYYYFFGDMICQGFLE